MMLQESFMDSADANATKASPEFANDEAITIQTRRKLIRPRGANQTL